MNGPDPEVILTATQLRIMKLRTELSFLLSDFAHGGAPKTKEREEILVELRELTK